MTPLGSSVPGSEKDEEVEGVAGALDLPIFPNPNPIQPKFYILIPTVTVELVAPPTKQTNTSPNPNPNLTQP